MVDEMADYSAGLTAEIRVVLMVSLRAVASEAEKVEKKGDIDGASVRYEDGLL
jgi:hypothetical protein